MSYMYWEYSFLRMKYPCKKCIQVNLDFNLCIKEKSFEIFNYSIKGTRLSFSWLMLPWVYNMRIKFTIWMSLSEVIKTISTYCMRACVKCISTSTHFFFYNSLVDCNKSLHKYFKERENALYNLLIAGWAMFFYNSCTKVVFQTVHHNLLFQNFTMCWMFANTTSAYIR